MDTKHHINKIKQSMVDNENLSDLTFIVGPEKQKIHSFKLLLALSNEVFKKQFFGGFADTGEIIIADADPEVFKIFLNYLYFGVVQVEISKTMDLFELSHRYLDQNLQKICEILVVESINPSNIFEIMISNEIFMNTMIFNGVREYFQSNTLACLQFSTSFKDLSIQTVTNLLELEQLNCNEEILYRSCFDWAVARCDTTNQVTSSEIFEKMKDFIPLLRVQSQGSSITEPIFSKNDPFPKYPRRTTFGKQEAISYHSSSAHRIHHTIIIRKKSIPFGFSVILSNFGSRTTEENFTLTVSCSCSNFIKRFKYHWLVFDYMSVKEFIFSEPMVLEPGSYSIWINFERDDKRMFAKTSDSESTSIMLYRDNFVERLHQVFEKDQIKESS